MKKLKDIGKSITKKEQSKIFAGHGGGEGSQCRDNCRIKFNVCKAKCLNPFGSCVSQCLAFYGCCIETC
ncbi:hypothetical protein [Aquimarina algiphila]|uniref:hypothetical protein n=1 Tax=Aquimarina algiphila TaxID=2047982 RepID=UPI00232B3240|nr:hypothetical protein [Aquimarina algiphila]